MQRELPANSLDTDLVEYLEEARADEMSLRRDASGSLSWWVPEATEIQVANSKWLTPEVIPSRSSSRSGVKLQLKGTKAGAKEFRGVEGESEACFSNVSPADVLPQQGLQHAGCARIDLRAAAEKAARMRNLDLESVLNVGDYSSYSSE